MRRYVLAFLLGVLLAALPGTLAAKCQSRFIDPLVDVAWEGAFPIKIGGVTIVHSDPELSDAPDKTSSPVCSCGEPPNLRVGILASFWEPIYIIDTVMEPGCFPALGVDVNVPGKDTGRGSKTARSRPSEFSFYHAHLIKFPLWVGLDLLTDLPCWGEGMEEFLDIGYMTEVDPLWNDDLLAMILHPEVLVFASLPAQFACISDSIASNVKVPFNELFWCVGSWGSAYPMTGNIGNNDPLTAGALAASRLIYKLTRELVVPDAATNECGYVRLPIWRKNHWRLQLIRPKRSGKCFPLGRSPLRKWGWNVGDPGKDLNLSWIVWRKHICCVAFSIF